MSNNLLNIAKASSSAFNLVSNAFQKDQLTVDIDDTKDFIKKLNNVFAMSKADLSKYNVEVATEISFNALSDFVTHSTLDKDDLLNFKPNKSRFKQAISTAITELRM